jgi:hypothetical protein
LERLLYGQKRSTNYTEITIAIHPKSMVDKALVSTTQETSNVGLQAANKMVGTAYSYSHCALSVLANDKAFPGCAHVGRRARYCFLPDS